MESLLIIVLAVLLTAAITALIALVAGRGRVADKLATRTELERERCAREALGSELRTKQSEQSAEMRDRIGKVHARIDKLGEEVHDHGGRLQAIQSMLAELLELNRSNQTR